MRGKKAMNWTQAMQQKLGWKVEPWKGHLWPLQNNISGEVQNQFLVSSLHLLLSSSLCSLHFSLWQNIGGRHELPGSKLLQVWFHFIWKFLSKWLIYFSLMYALCMCYYLLLENWERLSMPLSLNHKSCNAIHETKRTTETCWALEIHKSTNSILVSFKASYYFATSYLMVV